jgi:glycosyltransferase involved in cell wall biosynthesis
MTGDVVTVVIPAYNAENTIGEALNSVRAQTHAALEVLIVDDGSTDRTADIVRLHAAEDRRFRLIRQSNLGVAVARNRGIAEARADLVAPLDADDLWHPDKIAKQAALMRASDFRVGLVYGWSATIDSAGRVVGYRHRPMAQGKVFSSLCKVNLVGNGSAALIRKAALLECGGYDPALRARNAGGCEDLKVYLQIAERYEFRVVPEYLTGYRRAPGNMSSNWTRMFRSFEIVAGEFESRLPDTADDFHDGRNFMLRFLLIRAVREGQIANSRAIAAAMFAHDWRYAVAALAAMPVKLASNIFIRQMGTRFPAEIASNYFAASQRSAAGESAATWTPKRS